MYLVVVVMVPYVWKRLERQSIDGRWAERESEGGRWNIQSRVWKVMSQVERIYELATLVNFIIFLREGV